MSPLASLMHWKLAFWRDPLEELLAHHDTGAAGIIVQHDRQLPAPVDGQAVAHQFAFRGQRVIRRCNQHTVGTGFARRVARSAASSVRASLTPAIIGTRPPITSFA